MVHHDHGLKRWPRVIWVPSELGSSYLSLTDIELKTAKRGNATNSQSSERISCHVAMIQLAI